MTTPTPSRSPGLAATVALYALARLGVVAVVAAVLVLIGVPLAVAALVGIIVALPLSMVLFRGLRTRLDAALAVAGERRSRERESLRARLRGNEVPPADVAVSDDPARDDPTQRQADGAGG